MKVPRLSNLVPPYYKKNLYALQTCTSKFIIDLLVGLYKYFFLVNNTHRSKFKQIGICLSEH